jgi:hypothetical protein
MSLLVGITNARLSPAKRGVAVELATRLAAASDAPVCLIGADPTDRDVQRHLPQLVEAWGAPNRMHVERGPHHLEIASFARSRVCVVSVSDRDSVELVLPMLQQRFGFLIVDAPSLTGFGVGIADVLLDWLDALVIATGLGAGELAETRRYAERLDALPSARHVDVRVLPVGDPSAGGLAHEQLDSRLATLPTIGHVPRLRGGANGDSFDDRDLDAAFRPIIEWIVDEHTTRPRTADPRTNGTCTPRADTAPPTESTDRHVANRLYQETFDL